MPASAEIDEVGSLPTVGQDFQTFNELLLDTLKNPGSNPCFKVAHNDGWRDISYRLFRHRTLRLAEFFHQQGLAGQRLAIWAPNSAEWMIGHMAGLLTGGAIVPIRTTLPYSAVRHQLLDAGAFAVLAAGQERLDWLREVRTELPSLELVLSLEDPPSSKDKAEHGVTFWSKAIGGRLDRQTLEQVKQRAKAVEPDAVATIVYARDPEGAPLGVVFDQRQRYLAMAHMRRWFELSEDDLAFTSLPWSYMPCLETGLHCFLSGINNVLSQHHELVFEEVQQVSPTLVLTSPSALERVYDEIIKTSIRDLPESTQEMFYWALATGKQFRAAGSGASDELRERFARADMTFFSRIRGAFGGRFRRFFSTGAPLARGLAESIQAIGLHPINVYGTVESGGFPAVNLATSSRPDSCGLVSPGFRLRIAEDSEVLLQGSTVMTGYWRRPEETSRVLNEDGWLHTGDLGFLDEDGNLHLTGRTDSSLLLSTGQRLLPRQLEEALEASPFIERAGVFGERRPFTTALLVPDIEALADHFRRPEGPWVDPPTTDVTKPAASTLRWFWQGDDESEVMPTAAHPEVKELLDSVVDEVNKSFDQHEGIRAYALVGQLESPAAERLASDLEQARLELNERWQTQVQELYPRDVRPSEREITQVTVGPERLRELLEKESILDAWSADAGIGFLFGLAREHRIDAPSVVHICDTAATIAQVESEGRPLSTALIVGDPPKIHRVLESSLIQLHRHDHIRRMRNRLVDLARLVDGLVLAYVVDRHGYVRGICRLHLDLATEPWSIFGPQFRLHAEVSRRCDAVVFFVPRGGRQVRVFAHGQLVGRYSNGDWAPENAPLLENALQGLKTRQDYDTSLVARLLRCAFRMSEQNQGAIFMLGDAGTIMARSDAPEISHFARIASSDLTTLNDDELINFAKQDGATVIDAETGTFRGCMVLLRPNAATRADIGPGKGARHSSAAKMSAEACGLAITVSQDGPITLYECGQRLLSL